MKLFVLMPFIQCGVGRVAGSMMVLGWFWGGKCWEGEDGKKLIK